MLPLSGRDATPDNASAKADGPPDIIIRDRGDYATEEDYPSHYPQSKKGAHTGTYRKAVFHQYQKGRDFLVPFAHYFAMQGIVCYTVFYFRVVYK